ncbi:MAG: hypothetical protein DRO15_00540 [Thermoprotei archaeon]|nr:MAG: hypothetical protein DRO15_00540 [Thermoprotei archaeon]
MVEETFKEKRQSSSQHVLSLEDAKQVICYPEHYATPEECNRRIEELRREGVKHILSMGKTKIGRISVLGKGHAGIISAALLENGKVIAVKIRRFDSKRKSLEREAILQYLAALVNVAPTVYAFSRNFIMMEIIQGITLGEYLETKYCENNEHDIFLVTRSLIKKAFILDCIGIEHLELSNPRKQVMVQDYDPEKVFILDYESAKYTPRASNVTSIIGFIIGKGKKYFHLDIHDLENLIKLSKIYKKTLDISYRYIILNRFIDILNKYDRGSQISKHL